MVGTGCTRLKASCSNKGLKRQRRESQLCSARSSLKMSVVVKAFAICLALCAESAVANGGCTADGGKLTAPKDCLSDFMIKGQVLVGSTVVHQSEVFKGCAPINDEIFRPVEIDIDENGNVVGNNGVVYEPTLEGVSKDYFCLTGKSVYSTYDENLRPPWGYCKCESFSPAPTGIPSGAATQVPTGTPNSQNPSSSPSLSPSVSPSKSPAIGPSASPSSSPTTGAPSEAPSKAPSKTPTQDASGVPTSSPSTSSPTLSPVDAPTVSPTFGPSKTPSMAPSSAPSAASSCKTDGGHKFVRDCMFPFVYNGVSYNECIPFSDTSISWPYMNEGPLLEDSFETTKAWCAIVENYSNNKKATRKLWGTCDCWPKKPENECQVDGILNGNETDVDCGGPLCEACNVNQLCNTTNDCAEGLLCLDDKACGTVTGASYRERLTLEPGLSSAAFEFVGELIRSRLANNSALGADNVTISIKELSPPLNCTTEGGWAPDGTSCAFPFTYNKVVYSSCLDMQVDETPYMGNESSVPPNTPPSLYQVHWCPVVSNYSETDMELREQWGFCDCQDTWPTRSPTRFPTRSHDNALPSWCSESLQLWNETNRLLDHLWAESHFMVSGFAMFGNSSDHATPHIMVDSRTEQEKLSSKRALDISFEFKLSADQGSMLDSRESVASFLLPPIFQALDPFMNGTNGVPAQCTPQPTMSSAPTESPVLAPSVSPTKSPSAAPIAPTSPTTPAPSNSPSASPSLSPSFSPTTPSPSFSPSLHPSTSPTTGAPTQSPTTDSPSLSPSRTPSASPTTEAPTQSPTTDSPSLSPSRTPSASPTTEAPTLSPTTGSPTASPTSAAEKITLVEMALNNTNITGVGFVDHPACGSAVVQILGTGDDQLLDCNEHLESCSCINKILSASSSLSVLCLGRLQATLVSSDLMQRCGWV